jgi:Zn-dependent peptidase ImmA (M78 family)
MAERPNDQASVPVIVVNESVGLERRRFTLAHELAHRVISVRPNKETEFEKYCDRFGGAFLIPQENLEREIGGHRNALGYREILDIKRLYGVAASAILVRLEQIGVISRNHLEYGFRTFARGWRSTEPEPLDANGGEQPGRFERLVYRALAEDIIVPIKAAELLRRPIAEVEEGLKGPAHADHR